MPIPSPISGACWEKSTKYRVMAGVILIVLPIGIPWYYGNLATYSASYLRSTAGPDSVQDSTWMLSIFFIGMSSGQVASGTLASLLGLGPTLLLSNLLFDVGIFSTYFSVQHSLGLTLLTFMAVPGFFTGVVLALAFGVTADWFRGPHVGVASSAVSVAFSVGAIVYNEMTTALINPANVAPDLIEGNMVFFTQPEILGRYPFVFLAIGIVSVLFQMCAMLLIRKPPATTGNDSVVDEKIISTNFAKQQPIDTDVQNQYNSGCEMLDMTMPSQLENTEDPDITSHRDTYNTFQHSNSNCLPPFLENSSAPPDMKRDIKSNGDVYNTFQHSNSNSFTAHANMKRDILSNGDAYNTFQHSNWNSLTSPPDMKPSEAVKTVAFHILWFSSFSMAFGYLVVNNYYKLFGQVWIGDDSFLATVGTASTISGGVMRVLTGVAIDRLGLKTVMIAFTAASTVFLAFWYPSVRAGAWFYLVFTNGLSGLFSSSFILFPVATLLYFGHAHYPTNYGLVMTSTLLANLMAPVVFPVLLGNFGWFVLFISVGGMCGLTVAVVVVVMPGLSEEDV